MVIFFAFAITHDTVASWEQHVLIVAMLVWMGADPDIKNFYKLSPKDEARGEVRLFPDLVLTCSLRLFISILFLKLRDFLE